MDGGWMTVGGGMADGGLWVDVDGCGGWHTFFDPFFLFPTLFMSSFSFLESSFFDPLKPFCHFSKWGVTFLSCRKKENPEAVKRGKP